MGFFAIAAAWGFGIGLTTLALGLAAAGRRAAFDVELLKAVLPGLVAAVAGGVVAAAAYREIRDRRRP